MSINWQKEVEKRKEDLFKDLFSLLEIPSVRDDGAAEESAPVGPGPRDALLKFLEIGERDGFQTKNVENIAGHIEYGDGEETLGIFGHVDVVPVGDGWDSDPFTPEIRDGKLYARGSSDDKGPSMAAYYGLKIIKDLGLPLSKRVRFIIGTDEESEWKCMDRYLKVEKKPDFGFSPDAEFPIINGEKGMLSFHLKFNGSNQGSYRLVTFTSGIRENMVPDEAKAVVQVETERELADLNEKFERFLNEKKVPGGKFSTNGLEAMLEITGKASHGAFPQNGINAGTYLAKFLNDFSFDGDAAAYLKFIADYLHEDFFGKKSGIAHVDEKMGELTQNPGIFSFSASDDVIHENTVVVNIRYPQGTTPDKMAAIIKEKLQDTAIIETGRAEVPHYVPADDELVVTLLAVYEEYTGQKGHEEVIGGGTYGRLLDRGVAFGAMFPGREDTMHQPNEYMLVDDILLAAVIYADAIYRLAK